MRTQIKKLIGVLQEECKLYGVLITLAAREKDAGIKLDIEMLNESGKDKEICLLKLKKLEAERIQLHTRIAKALGYSTTDLTLSKLEKMQDEPYSGMLKDCSAELRRLLENLNRQNRHNQDLFTHSLELLRGSYNLLGNLTGMTPVYYSSGNMKAKRMAGNLLHDNV